MQGQDKSCQFRSGQVNSKTSQVRSGKVKYCQVKSGHVRCEQVKTGQSRSDHIRIGRNGLRQVRDMSAHVRSCKIRTISIQDRSDQPMSMSGHVKSG